MYYRDLHDFVDVLDKKGKLIRIDRPINKDLELMPLVRWQFRGLNEDQRKAFLFTNVHDVKGNKYKFPVLVGSLAATREIYAMGMGVTEDQMLQRWTEAQRNPIPPILVSSGPCQEEVHTGDGLLEHGGLMELPIPISTPGFDNAPYTTASHWFTKDADNGLSNVGNYRGQLKSPTRLGACVALTQHIGIQWQKWRKLRQPMPAALVIGVTPNISFAAVSKIPYGLQELDVAGGIAGQPVAMVRCKTVPIEVPATAEIVIEGFISTDYLEPEAPFGEYTGYMGDRTMHPYFDVSAITHRRDAFFHTIISQFPASESSKVKQIGTEANYYKFLRYDCNVPGVLEVAFHEIAVRQYCVIRLRKTNPAQAWQVLNAAIGYHSSTGKIIIVVDEDVDARDPDAVNAALCWYVEPHLDVAITMGRSAGLDPSPEPPGASTMESAAAPRQGASAILIDATRKSKANGPTRNDYFANEYMTRARDLWEELDLPRFK